MPPNEFKWKHFAPPIIIWCLRWYGSTTLGYANVSDTLTAQRFIVDLLSMPPFSVKNAKKYQFIRSVSSWQLDETYVKVNGKWFYLYRAIDKYGDTLDVYFSPKRNRYAVYAFLKRVLKPYRSERQPKTLNTDKHAAYGYAIARLIKEGKLRADVKQRQIKTLNNRIESDHAPIKKLIVATGGFKSAKRAWPTLQGF
ncbi:TPA: IS6 family transposase [Providencia alcalifaciens]